MLINGNIYSKVQNETPAHSWHRSPFHHPSLSLNLLYLLNISISLQHYHLTPTATICLCCISLVTYNYLSVPHTLTFSFHSPPVNDFLCSQAKAVTSTWLVSSTRICSLHHFCFTQTNPQECLPICWLSFMVFILQCVHTLICVIIWLMCVSPLLCKFPEGSHCIRFCQSWSGAKRVLVAQLVLSNFWMNEGLSEGMIVNILNRMDILYQLI